MNSYQINILSIISMVGLQTVNLHALYLLWSDPKCSLFFLYIVTYNSFINWEIVRGSYNLDIFINFIKEKVIPHTMPHSDPRSVLIIDNTKIDHRLVCLHNYLLLTMLHMTFQQYVRITHLFAAMFVTLLKKHLYS